MTENKAQVLLCQMYLPCFEDMEKEAITMAIQALEEIQSYRAIGTVEELREMRSVDFSEYLLNMGYTKGIKDGYKKAIDDFAEQLKVSTENMFGQKYVDVRTVEKIAKQLSYDDAKQPTISEFAEWVFCFVDGYHFSSKEEMIAEWNKQLKR